MLMRVDHERVDGRQRIEACTRIGAEAAGEREVTAIGGVRVNAEAVLRL